MNEPGEVADVGIILQRTPYNPKQVGGRAPAREQRQHGDQLDGDTRPARRQPPPRGPGRAPSGSSNVAPRRVAASTGTSTRNCVRNRRRRRRSSRARPAAARLGTGSSTARTTASSAQANARYATLSGQRAGGVDADGTRIERTAAMSARPGPATRRPRRKTGIATSAKASVFSSCARTNADSMVPPEPDERGDENGIVAARTRSRRRARRARRRRPPTRQHPCR